VYREWAQGVVGTKCNEDVKEMVDSIIDINKGTLGKEFMKVLNSWIDL
jgi:hypothetical protein